jgi:putative hemolysin
MTPRIDVVALDLSEKKDDLVKVMKKHQYSRLPAYIQNLDNIAGIVYTKEFLLNPIVPFRELIRPPYFVPESMKLDDLLREMQIRKVHIAVVTDEYGVTSGIVTIEDILEEIVGEIRDEHDNESPKIKPVSEGIYEIRGETHINDVNEALKINIETDEVDTIAGYVTMQFGKIPSPGESIDLLGYNFNVSAVLKNRITYLKVSVLLPPATEVTR